MWNYGNGLWCSALEAVWSTTAHGWSHRRMNHPVENGSDNNLAFSPLFEQFTHFARFCRDKTFSRVAERKQTTIPNYIMHNGIETEHTCATRWRYKSLLNFNGSTNKHFDCVILNPIRYRRRHRWCAVPDSNELLRYSVGSIAYASGLCECIASVESTVWLWHHGLRVWHKYFIKCFNCIWLLTTLHRCPSQHRWHVLTFS